MSDRAGGRSAARCPWSAWSHDHGGTEERGDGVRGCDAGRSGWPRTAKLLEKLDAATPWETLAAPIRALDEYNNPGAGNPPWCPVLMLKGLMLAKWFNLSDPGVEEALRDRISFRRFLGLSFTDKTTDETTFVKFRARLREAEIHDAVFDAVVKHIERKGLLVKQGTMVDATIIEAPRGRPRPDGTTTRDQDASFTSKHGVPHHGYKGHTAADLSGIVTDYRFGTAKVHDSNHIDDLTMHEKTLSLADSAHSKDQRRAELRARGVIDGIISKRKRKRNQSKLYDWQERWNGLVAPLRARVEHPNAMMKQQLGSRRVRYRGRERNAFDFALILPACNIKRSLSLKPG
ncbi:MAG: IS5 family transposase [Phycisphaerales bacterium]